MNNIKKYILFLFLISISAFFSTNCVIAEDSCTHYIVTYKHDDDSETKLCYYCTEETLMSEMKIYKDHFNEKNTKKQIAGSAFRETTSDSSLCKNIIDRCSSSNSSSNTGKTTSSTSSNSSDDENCTCYSVKMDMSDGLTISQLVVGDETSIKDAVAAYEKRNNLTVNNYTFDKLDPNLDSCRDKIRSCIKERENQVENYNTNNLVSCGNNLLTDIPRIIPKSIHRIYLILEIVVPLLLIIFGSIDFVKAVIAQKEDEIKKGQQTFIKRLIIGVIIFFVFSIVKLVISLAADKGNRSNIINCADCLINNNEKCEVG